MSNDNQIERDICVHIFTGSAAMIGVCLTVIGIIHLIIGVKKIDTIADDMLAIDSFIFLSACILAYFGLRADRAKRRHRLEACADLCFLFGLLVMVIVGGLVVLIVT